MLTRKYSFPLSVFTVLMFSQILDILECLVAYVTALQSHFILESLFNLTFIFEPQFYTKKKLFFFCSDKWGDEKLNAFMFYKYLGLASFKDH